LSVALVLALARVRGATLAPAETRELAHEAEKVFHGTPSGVDDAVAAHGGVMFFKSGGRDAEPMDVEMPPLVIGETGVSRSTARLVEGVRSALRKDGAGVESLFDGIGRCVLDGAEALRAGDHAGLGDAMNRNQRLLERLGVSSPEIDEMVSTAMAEGARGAKLTGAGGGGCVIALAPGREMEIVRGWNRRGFCCWISQTGGFGA
jgi:mevalonate kinase